MQRQDLIFLGQAKTSQNILQYFLGTRNLIYVTHFARWMSKTPAILVGWQGGWLAGWLEGNGSSIERLMFSERLDVGAGRAYIGYQTSYVVYLILHRKMVEFKCHESSACCGNMEFVAGLLWKVDVEMFQNLKNCFLPSHRFTAAAAGSRPCPPVYGRYRRFTAQPPVHGPADSVPLGPGTPRHKPAEPAPLPSRPRCCDL